MVCQLNYVQYTCMNSDSILRFVLDAHDCLVTTLMKQLLIVL